jgi:ribosomal protein L28
MALGPAARARKRQAELAAEVPPKSVYRRGPSLFYVCIDRSIGRQAWHPLGPSWNVIARKEWKRLMVQNLSSAHVERNLYSGERGGPVPVDVLRVLLTNAKKNAKARRLSCTLTLAELLDVALRGHGRCELTGIKFEYGVAQEVLHLTTRRRRVWAPSIDRVDGARGYEADNVRLVCLAANAARQEFGDEVLFRLARGLSNIQHQGIKATRNV